MRRRTRRHHRPHTRSPLSSLLRAHLSRVASPSPTRNLRRPYRPCTSPPALSPRQGDRRPRDEHRRRRRGLRLLWLEPQPRIGASRRDCAREIFNQGESGDETDRDARLPERLEARSGRGGRRRPPAPLRTPGSSSQPSPTTPISVLGAPWRRICGWTCRAERRAECPRREAPVTRHGAGAVPAPLSRALAHGQTRWRVVSSLRAGVRVWRVPAGVLPLSAGAAAVAGARCDCPAPLCYCY